MIRPYTIPVWKKAPFIRLLLPLIAGILLQWYLKINQPVIITAFISFSISFLLFYLLPEGIRFKLQFVQGFIVQLLMISVGLWLTWQKDIRNNQHWYGNYYKEGDYIVVRIGEPPTEKAKSFKADCYVESIVQDGKSISCKGKLLLYFSKDSSKINLQFGDRIIIHNNIQSIKNSGNPGGFNYERYAGFQGIFHNVFLKNKDWVAITGKDSSAKNVFWEFIYNAREYVLSVLKKSLNTGKDELGIAQALLIGYTNDLDKDLVQAYSNTGVVHIIAISGMHLGLIYVLLVWLFAKIPFIKKSKHGQVILILACLWLFAILTGASPSVMRAAVMFSFISLGKNYFKAATIYNALAASAFALLCYNPYYLWAVGFQLSYLAVLGIVIFQRPIYNIWYIRNKWIDKLWMLISVSIAAQLLTFPVCIYYFHQFPNLFLLSNIIAVPMAMLILYSAIVLLTFSWIPFVGPALGKLVGWLTWALNKTILWINDLSFAVWDRIPATVFSTVLLYAVVALFSAWLIQRNKKYFTATVIALLLFTMQNRYGKWLTANQQKIIVYNVPQHRAIDFVSGSSYQFAGDSILLEDGMLKNFHLKPSRIALQLTNREDSTAGNFNNGIFYQFLNKRIVNIQQLVNFETPPEKIYVDLIIISKNPKITITQLLQIFSCKQFVFDASNPAWKIKKWQQECRMLQVNQHAVSESGAYVYNIGI